MASSEATTYLTGITCEQMKNAEDYIQEYILAWLDTAMDDDNGKLDVSLGLLRTIQQVSTFKKVNECFEYLSSNTQKRTFLILSCTIDDHLLNDFIALPQMEYIYTFGKETILKKEQSKLVEMTSIQDVYSHLSGNPRYSTEEDNRSDFASLTSAATVRSIRDFNGDAQTFIFYQLLIEILLQLPKTPEIKKQFISFCEENTKDNPEQWKIFQKRMESYKPDQAILWYTDTSFLHKLLNRTCRLGNIKNMFKLAFFIVDLNAQLKFVHREYFDYYADQVHVYRGRPMSTVQFEKLGNSIGDLVVTKSFLSTTVKRDVASFYSGAGTKKPNFVPAILHMIINKQINETKSFARIRYNSQIREDDEVLISIGAIFRIIRKDCKNGINEFVLFRGDEEKKVECEMENAFREQANKNNTFFQLDSSTDGIECSEQIQKILTTSNDQTTASHGDKPSSTTGEKSISGITDRRLTRLGQEMKKLEEINDIFIIDHYSLCETSQDSSSSSAASSKLAPDFIIKGRILPKLEPYCQHSFRIRFILSREYPFEIPQLRFLDPMYHPNIDTNGKLCSRLLEEKYHPKLSLAEIVLNAEQLISCFDRRLVINREAYEEFENNHEEFNRKTLKYILRYGHSRT